MTRTLSCLIIAAVLLGGAGCAGVTEPFGVEDPFAIPKPFQGVARNDAMLQEAAVVPAVVVEAPRGLDGEFGAVLRDKIVASAQARDVPALTEPTVRAWVLSARVARIFANDGNHGAAGERAVISWELFDEQGGKRAHFAVAFAGNEATLAASEIAALAKDTAAQLDAALMRPATQVAEKPQASEQAVAWIGAIRGAPGDGNVALARSLAAILPMKGVRVDGAKANAQWLLEGRVRITKASPKEDLVTLTWRVLDAKGVEVGKIEQENAVPRGRLRKTWAEIAGFAAEAAAEGIAQLIQQVSEAKPG
jgi:hypothetical protein